MRRPPGLNSVTPNWRKPASRMARTKVGSSASDVLLRRRIEPR